jgi:Gas vesicle synthesis protein GvpL/GvpF
VNGRAGPAGCYTFGVIPADALLPAGIDGSPLADHVDGVLIGAVQAVVGRVSFDEITGDGPRDTTWLVPRVVAHDRVLLAVAGAHAIVPFRFGVVHRDEAAMARVLGGASDSLGRALRRVAGRLEWTISINAEVAGGTGLGRPPGGGPGRTYLAARGAQLAVRASRDEIVAEVARYCDDGGIPTVRLPPRHDGARRLACLVLRGAEIPLLSRLSQFSNATPGARISLTGPLPPYHFVEVPDHDSAGSS